MKKLLLILISLSLSYCFSQNEQNIVGKWYMINKSGFVEFTISNDSLFNEKLFPDFSSKSTGKRAAGIVERVNLKDRILLLGENPKNTSEFYTLMTLAPSEKGNSLKYIWNGIDSISTIKTITKLNQDDDRQLLSFDLYSKEYLDTFNKKKSIDKMTLSDFKKYLEIYFSNLKVASAEYKKNIKAYYGEASSFNFQISISSLLEMNYNPIQTSKSINSLFAMYIEKNEVKELIKKLKEN